MKDIISQLLYHLTDRTDVFDESLYKGSNKLHGAFQLRKKYKFRLILSFIISTFCFVSFTIVWLFFEINSFKEEVDLTDIIEFKTFDSALPPIPKELLVPKLSSSTQPNSTDKIEKKSNESTTPKIVKEVTQDNDKKKKTETVPDKSIDTDSNSAITKSDSLESSGNSSTGKINSSEKQISIEPIGGINEFVLYVQKNVKFPEDAIRYKISGTVYVYFVVNELGKIEDLKFTKKLGYGIEEEIARVISDAPDWKPLTVNGVPQKNKVHVPIKLNLPK